MALCLITDNTNTLYRCTILITADLNTGLRAAGMNYLSSADIDCHMIDIALAITVKYQIARF